MSECIFSLLFKRWWRAGESPEVNWLSSLLVLRFPSGWRRSRGSAGTIACWKSALLEGTVTGLIDCDLLLSRCFCPFFPLEFAAHWRGDGEDDGDGIWPSASSVNAHKQVSNKPEFEIISLKHTERSVRGLCCPALFFKSKRFNQIQRGWKLKSFPSEVPLGVWPPYSRLLFGISLKPDCVCLFLRFLFHFPSFTTSLFNFKRAFLKSWRSSESTRL